MKVSIEIDCPDWAGTVAPGQLAYRNGVLGKLVQDIGARLSNGTVPDGVHAFTRPSGDDAEISVSCDFDRRLPADAEAA